MTVPNDGSVSGDSCLDCNGKLTLKTIPRGGFFLGCSNYPRGCYFKMAPNSEESRRLEAEKKARREARLEREKAREQQEMAKAEAEKIKKELEAPKYCENCFTQLSRLDVNAKRLTHIGC